MESDYRSSSHNNFHIKRAAAIGTMLSLLVAAGQLNNAMISSAYAADGEIYCIALVPHCHCLDDPS
jgi:hypothetical protein